ncbi:isoprenyl transferase [Dissulfurispira thermophila]|uniref:Isoprenyl transferase n=2 Tax=Dissulfurispira thermophila TaxID=2715679 RepID=A0A7G1GY61_9BACT|nr:isoprenyl transferase [Dissulfurispira thermophila]BCB95360.1 isoprenyl transferase [Dissulfurispira thermophila]
MKKRAIPRHIGIIMDGNGRWAEMRGLPRFEGHKRGVQRVKEIVEVSSNIGVEVLSLYAFSIENWMRPVDEVSVIIGLLEKSLKGEFLNFMKEGVRFKVIGNRDKLPENIKSIIETTEHVTENNKGLILQCAISYGGRDEIIRAIRKAINQDLSPEDITEDSISRLLDTAGIPDPDLIIRTSGEQRLSNFLLWQSAYSEFYFTDTLWPDFTKEELLEAIHEYQMRDRRFGKVAIQKGLNIGVGSAF